ncbi:MAG: amino acid permease [Methanomicrobium sp.]|nr:amino acid permease [Methanomicrobium sp.]
MSPAPASLCRNLSFMHVLIMGIGMTIGAGIFVLIGIAAGEAGDFVWLSFIIAGIAALLTGLSYAELSSIFPKAGAEYEYVSNAFGRRPGIMIGCVIIVACIFAGAMMITSCADYISSVIGIPPLIIALLLVPLFLIILLRKVIDTARFVIMITIAEIGCLVLLFFLSIPYGGADKAFEMPFGFAGVLSASAIVFVAYAGFEGIVKLSEETLDAERVIPRALIAAILCVSFLYGAAAYGVVSIVGWEALSVSSTPVTLAFETALHLNSANTLVSLVIVLATAVGGIMILFAGSRVLYGMSSAGILSSAFSQLSVGQKVPAIAVTFVVLLSIPLIFFGNLQFLADITNFFFIFSFIIINLSVIALRVKNPEYVRNFRIPFTIGPVPVTSLAGAIVLLCLLSRLPAGILFVCFSLILIIWVFSGFIKKS